MTKGALAHLRVLDLSRVLAGPWAGQMLADLGAEVIKVEKPGQGDDTRAWGPPFLKDDQGRDTRESAYYLSANRGKQSLAIDFTQAEGQQLVRQLAADCDVVLENFKAGGWPNMVWITPVCVRSSPTSSIVPSPALARMVPMPSGPDTIFWSRAWAD